jgi:hypothetical protein
MDSGKMQLKSSPKRSVTDSIIKHLQKENVKREESSRKLIRLLSVVNNDFENEEEDKES